jgi:RsiW-degrading membrane proteinase PrsW (M82 family)
MFAVVIAVAIPLLFLALVRWLDLYASGSLRTVVFCLLWGAVAFYLALQVNTFAMRFVGYTLLLTLVAPIIEEILKSLLLIYLVRRPDFTYFVDGAIYGFAAGTAFALLENILYLGRAGADAGLLVALSRGLSTSLMHGSASALVGIALGRLRFSRGSSRVASLFLGWAAAMALHITFNNVVHSNWGLLTLGLAMVLGLGGLGLIAGFIFWGLAAERRWLQETLTVAVGVSAGEAAVVQQMADLDTLLAPVVEHFGAAKRQQVARFLQLQAQLGLKRKAQALTPDPALAAALAQQVDALRQEMDELRRAVGVYCMTYVRSILPPASEPLWTRLAAASALTEQDGAAPGRSLWGALDERLGSE